jgi:hypothetical protein
MSELPPHDWHAPILRMIVDAYGRTRAPVYVEIGVDQGHTLRTVAPAAAEIHAVDPNLLGTRGFHDNRITWHEKSSDEFFADFSGPADLIFIDGDHSQAQVGHDVANAYAALRDDGMIAIHDTLPLRQEWADSHCGEGWRVVEVLRAGGELQVFTLPLFPGLTFVAPPPAPLIGDDPTRG